MFYNENIIGVTQVVIDTRNRFIVPSFTGVSFGDELLLYGDNGFLSIYEKQCLLDCFYSLQSNKGIENFYQQKASYDSFFDGVLGSVVVDRQNRICLSQCVVDFYRLCHYDENNKKIAGPILVKGAWDHINIFSGDMCAKRLVSLK